MDYSLVHVQQKAVGNDGRQRLIHAHEHTGFHLQKFGSERPPHTIQGHHDQDQSDGGNERSDEKRKGYMMERVFGTDLKWGNRVVW